MSIVVVDDAADNRVLVRSLLKRNGYENVIAIESAVELFEFLRLGSETSRESPALDLIVMDLMMPQIDGIEACRRVKAEETLREIPVIMLTASYEVENLEASFAAGAIDFITKPVKRLELLARVHSALTLKHETDCRKARERELLQIKSQLETANLTLKRLAVEDGLTGIPNRRVFDEMLDREWSRAARDGQMLSLIFLDIDHFKQFNDTYGHQQGDSCLKEVARGLTNSLKRNLDTGARYGGEEFAAILPSTDSEGATVVAESIRAAIAGLKIPHESSATSPYVTASVGVATICPLRTSPKGIIVEAADQALYRAKKAGRNRVMTAEGCGILLPQSVLLSGESPAIAVEG